MYIDMKITEIEYCETERLRQALLPINQNPLVMLKRYFLSSAILISFFAMLFVQGNVAAQSCSFPTFTLTASYSFGGGGTPPSCWHQQVFYLEVSPQVSDPECGVWVSWEKSTDGSSWETDCCDGWGHGTGSVMVPTWYRATVNCSCGGNMVLEPYLVVPNFRPYITSSAPIEFSNVSLCDGPVTLSAALPDWADGIITVLGYQWHRYNVPISGATGASTVVTEVGGYSVTITYLDENGQQCLHEFVHIEGEPEQYTLHAHTNGCGCLNATEVQCGATVTGNNSSAPDENLSFYPQCEFGADNNAVWYKVTPPVSGTVTVSTCGSQFYSRVRVYEGPCPSLTSCTFNQDYCSFNGFFNGTVTFNAVGGQTYHILLTGAFSGSSGDYTMTITCPSACTGSPVGGTAQSSESSVCGSGTFNLSLTGNSQHAGQTYQWQRSQNGTVWENISGATSATYTASQSSAHHYRCVVTCGSSANSASVLVGHDGACPVNDCTQAVTVSCGTDHLGNSTGQEAADLTGAPFCGSGASTTRGVWHAFTAPADGQATFSTCNQETDYDTYMRVYDGCAQGNQSGGDMECLGSNDDAVGCGTGSELTVNLTQGQTYYVLITGFNAQHFGNYKLVSECPEPVCEVSISANGPLQLCPEGGTVILTALPAGATSYSWSKNGTHVFGAVFQSLNVSVGDNLTGPGTYTVTATYGNCTVTSAPVVVSLHPATEVGVLANSLEICSGQTTTFTGLPAGMAQYQWFEFVSQFDYEPIAGATSQSFSTGFAGTYFLEATDANGCGGISPNVVLVVHPAPFVSISGNTGLGSTLTATAGHPSYAWALNGVPIPGATGQTIVADQPGSYTVTVFNAFECSHTSDPHVISDCALGNMLPPVQCTANPSLACPGQQVTLSINQINSPHLTYQWQVSTDGGDNFTDIPAGTTHTIVVAVTGPSVFQCVVSCGSLTTEYHPVTVTLLGPASISATQPLCADGNSTLTAMPANAEAYIWYVDGQVTGNQQTINPLFSGEYTVTVVVDGCELMAGPVTVHPLPQFEIEPQTAEVCPFATTLLTGPSGMASYQWGALENDMFGPILGANSQTFDASTTHPFGIAPFTTFMLQATDANGCVGSATAFVQTLPEPEPVIVENLGTLTVTQPFQTYQWYHEYTGLFDANGQSHVPAENGQYYVEVTDENGCEGLSNAVLIGGPCQGSPEGGAAVASQTTLCPLDFFTLSLTGNSTNPGQTYQWQISADGAAWTDIAGAITPTYSAVFYPDMPYYRCIVTCDEQDSESLPVMVEPLFTASLSADMAAICPGATQSMLTALPANADQYTWFRGGTVLFNPANQHVTGQATDFVVHVTVDGCTMPTNTVTIEAIGAPDATVSPASIEICPGQQVSGTLSVPNGGPEDTYVWILDNTTINSGAGLSSINVLQTGNYEVEVTNPEGCKSTSAIVPVTFRPLPDASVIPEGVELCDGSVTQISAPPGMASYLWNPTGETAQTITIGTVITEHDVTVTDEHGCTNNSGPVAITVHPNPEVLVSPSSLQLCPDQEGTFTGSTGMAQYDWQPGGGNAQTLMVTLPAEVYILTVTDINGCAGSSDPVTVTPANGPQPTISLSGGGMLATQSGMASYQWFLNGTPIFPGNAATQNIVGDGAYTVTVTDANGCEGTSEPFTYVGIDGVDGRPAITLHPNPASDLLRISGLRGVAMAEVTDMAGRLVMTANTDDRHGIAIGHLASGSYLLRITDEGRSAVTLRFVRE